MDAPERFTAFMKDLSTDNDSDEEPKDHSAGDELTYEPIPHDPSTGPAILY